METMTNKATSDKSKELTIRVLEEIIPAQCTDLLRVRLWDGTLWPDNKKRQTTVVLNHPGALRAMFSGKDAVSLGEAYLHNDFDIEGNVEDVFPAAQAVGAIGTGVLKKMQILWELKQLPITEAEQNHKDKHRASLHGKAHSIKRDKEAIAFHYNASNEFYSLWLDRRMVYSCAYFQDENVSLDKAQERKLEHICRKLRLQPGEKLLDIGCGWGGMVMYAAEKYGVHATGITLSEAQLQFAQKRICEMGLEDRCQVQLQDYREIEGREQFDKLVSVGMVEHVGAAMLPQYFEQAYSLLKPGGVFLNHGIGRKMTNAAVTTNPFIEKYVFPDGELVPISEMLRVAENAHFEVRDVENLREHYMMTLRRWVQRLETNHDKILKMMDEETYRIWRIYMSGSAYGFRSGNLDLYQSLLCKTSDGGASGMPLTRDAWYI